MEEPLQLSLEVGGDEPEAASLRLRGKANVLRELRMGEEVYLRLTDADGIVLAEAEGEITIVSFEHHPAPTHGRAWTERVQVVSLR
jgi:hypothetical protein